MNEILAFVHIPKTAGTSARQALERAAGKEHTLSIGVNLPLAEFPLLTPQRLENTRVLFGHADAIQFRKIGARFRFAATVRDPVERAASYFNFIKVRRPESPLAKRIGNKTLLDASKNVQPFIKNISNLQCRMICGVANADLAIETIHREDWFVAPHKELDGLITLICAEYDWKWMPAPKFNVGKKGYKSALLEPETQEVVRALNTEDDKLVKFIASRMTQAIAG